MKLKAIFVTAQLRGMQVVSAESIVVIPAVSKRESMVRRACRRVDARFKNFGHDG